MNRIKMVRYRNEGQPVFVSFAREDNGMVIGCVQGIMGSFGENPREQVERGFLDHQFAMDWLKAQCRSYLGRDDVDFIVEESQPMIQVVKPQPQVRFKH